MLVIETLPKTIYSFVQLYPGVHIIAIMRQHLHNSTLNKQALRPRSQDQINSFGVNKVKIFLSCFEYVRRNSKLKHNCNS